MGAAEFLDLLEFKGIATRAPNKRGKKGLHFCWLVEFRESGFPYPEEVEKNKGGIHVEIRKGSRKRRLRSGDPLVPRVDCP